MLKILFHEIRSLKEEIENRMEAKRPIPLSVCRRLRVNYDTLADMYKAQSTSISAQVKSAEIRAVKTQVAKLGRCEREKNAIYQVLFKVMAKIVKFQKYYSYVREASMSRYTTSEITFQQTYEIACLTRRVNRLKTCLSHCITARCMKRCSVR